MNTISRIARLAMGAGAAAAALAPVSIQAEDASVASRLRAAGLTYQVDKDNDFRVIVSFPNSKRTQLVFVSGATHNTMNGVIMREVFSAMANVDNDAISGRALELLKANHEFTYGAYEIDGSMVLLNAKIPDSVSAQQLRQAVEDIASSADEKEKEISGDRDTY